MATHQKMTPAEIAVRRKELAAWEVENPLTPEQLAHAERIASFLNDALGGSPHKKRYFFTCTCLSEEVSQPSLEQARKELENHESLHHKGKQVGSFGVYLVPWKDSWKENSK